MSQTQKLAGEIQPGDRLTYGVVSAVKPIVRVWFSGGGMMSFGANEKVAVMVRGFQAGDVVRRNDNLSKGEIFRLDEIKFEKDRVWFATGSDGRQTWFPENRMEHVFPEKVA